MYGCCERFFDNMACDCKKRSVSKTFSLEDIKKLCLQYDKSYGDYVESMWQGLSLYKFIFNKLDPSLEFNSNDCDLWEEDMKNV